MNATAFDYEATETGLPHYFSDIKCIAPGLLTAEQERALGERIAAGDKAACDQLVSHNLRLVVHIAKKHRRDYVSLSDLIQEGNIGLMTAARKWDYQRGYRFGTYASWWIRQAITRFINEKSTCIHVPTHLAESASKLRKIAYRLHMELGREPELPELATAMNLDEAHILRIQDATRAIASLDTLLDGRDPDEAEATLSHFLPAPDGAIDDQVISAELKAAIESALAHFPARMADILRRRIGLDGETQTLEEVGKAHHITRERVRQLEARAMPILRKLLAETARTWMEVAS